MFSVVAAATTSDDSTSCSVAAAGAAAPLATKMVEEAAKVASLIPRRILLKDRRDAGSCSLWPDFQSSSMSTFGNGVVCCELVRRAQIFG